ncbi:hypothetical protein TU73_13685 [Pseudomonas libanensis]|uniref:Uncharacterized protein n=1 Tax=Pseudomonas libanensis TaxID=75588 RepID=A0A0R2YAZ0_9PSED|nr:hypothetical protein TU73_13685 [Pseudomonas libanensis]
MRAHQNNELNKLAAIMKIFAGKSQGFACGLLIGANGRPLAFVVPCSYLRQRKISHQRYALPQESARLKLQLTLGIMPIGSWCCTPQLAPFHDGATHGIMPQLK